MGQGDETSKKLIVPSCPEKSDEGYYEVNMLEEKIVRDFTGYNFDRLEELTIFEFWLYLRDAAIYNLQQTEEGREYLKKCWLSQQTEPDRGALRRQFGK